MSLQHCCEFIVYAVYIIIEYKRYCYFKLLVTFDIKAAYLRQVQCTIFHSCNCGISNCLVHVTCNQEYCGTCYQVLVETSGLSFWFYHKSDLQIS